LYENFADSEVQYRVALEKHSCQLRPVESDRCYVRLTVS
jgi:hypothetical protein